MKKPKVKFLCKWQRFHEKKQLFPQKPNFSGKKCLLSAKISYDFFSRELWFLKFSPCFRQKLRKATTNSLLLGRNHWKNAFSDEMWNTQEKPKDFFLKTQEKSQSSWKNPYTKVGSKSPTSWEKTKGVATLAIILTLDNRCPIARLLRHATSCIIQPYNSPAAILAIKRSLIYRCLA